MNYHSPWAIRTRNLARRLGLLRIVNFMVARRAQAYEEAFHQALKNSVQPGDTVWDIGANIGLYTNYFLDWVGPTGKVVAFEPLPAAVSALTDHIQSHVNAKQGTVIPVALSDKPGHATFHSNTSNEHELVTTTGHLTDSSDETSGGGGRASNYR